MTGKSAARAGDAMALGLSGLCLAHCLALPAAALALPVIAVWAEAEWVHWAFVAAAAPISLWTLTRRHPAGPPLGALVLALPGLALLVAGAAEFPDHDAALWVTVAGALLIAAAHLLNLNRRPHRC